MPTGGHTTLLQRVLDRRAEKPSTADEGTTATVAVMVRVQPPPKALLVFEDTALRAHTERRVGPELLEVECVGDEFEALRRFEKEFCPVVLTDNPEIIRTVRQHQGTRAPYILYVSDSTDMMEREVGLRAGADDCVERRVTDEEFNARVRSARRIAELEAALRVTLTDHRKLSATDDLTHVASRRFFGKHFPREVDRAARYGRALSTILCDIDHFKKINETLGHAGGDQVLHQFAQALQKGLRSGVDWVARLGGEEFVIVLPETPYASALEVARKLRTAVAESPFAVDKKKVQITASFGLCGIDHVPVGERRLAERILRIADAALYRSKHDGRNRVTATMLQRPNGSEK
jgi:two-component system, cell cycle response regulator